MGVDCEEMGACVVDSANDEVGSDVALVAGGRGVSAAQRTPGQACDHVAITHR
jgi:hypothetical protein